MNRRHSQAAACVICALLCVALQIPARPAAPQERSLLARAARVATVTGWLLHRTNLLASTPYWYTYRWLNSEQVAFIRDIPDSPDYPFYVQNIHTGKRRYLRRFSRLFAEHHRDLDFSPDGKWVMWGGSTHDEDRFFASRLDGSHYAPLRPPYDPEATGEWNVAFWMPDSRHWVEAYIRESTDRFTHATLRAIGPHTKAIRFAFPAVSRQKIQWIEHAGNRIAYWNSFAEGARTARFTLLGMGRHPPRPVHGLVRFPRPWQCSGALFSPDARHVAWILRDDHDRISSHAKRSGHARRMKRISLWISDRAGRHLHSLGTIRFRGNKDPLLEEPGIPEEFQWLPDSGHISFIYLQSLYKVAAR